MADKTRQKPGPKPKLEHSEQLIEQLRALGGIQATVEECAAVLRVSLRTLQNFFAAHEDAKEAHEEGKLSGLASLRRKQFNLAERNATMAIFLGKNYLGQQDIQQIEAGAPGDFDRMTLAELNELIVTEIRELGPELLLPPPEPVASKSGRKVTTKH